MMGRPKQVDIMAPILEKMSHAEFKEMFMTPRHMTEEDVWAQVPQWTGTPDEGEHHPVSLDREFNLPPSEMRYFRTWGVWGWK